MRQSVLVLLLLLATAPSVDVASPQMSGVRVRARARTDAAAGAWAGFMASAAAGGGANGIVADLTAKGNRMVRAYPSPETGAPAGSWIVDFDEQKTYRILPATQEYTEQTFGQVRGKIASQHSGSNDAIPGAEMFMPSTGVDLPRQSLSRAKKFDYIVDTQETGRRFRMAGQDAREIIQTVTAVERGKTLEQDGGWVVTNTLWLAPRIPAVNELVAAQRRYVQITTKGIYETAFTALEFPSNQFYDPFYPEHSLVGMRVIAEMEKLDGTVVSTLAVYELERTAKEFRSAQSQYEAQQRRLTRSGARVLGGGPPKRTRMVTLQLEYLSIDTNVTDADVAIPAGYKKK